MSELIIIAGPQAAGKSTAISQLNDHYQSVSPLLGKGKRPLFFPLQESRQIVIHKHMLLGAIFMTIEHEMEVISIDFQRMDTLASRDNRNIVHLDECNIFTIAHAQAHGVHGVINQWNSYIDRLQAMNAKIIFLDLPPEISWDRRRRKYEQRLVYFPRRQHRRIMTSYEQYLKSVYPMLHEIYSRLPLPKRMIDATRSSKAVILEVSSALADLSTRFN